MDFDTLYHTCFFTMSIGDKFHGFSKELLLPQATSYSVTPYIHMWLLKLWDWGTLWKEAWFMSPLASPNTIINCNCYFVSIHSPPSTVETHAFCLLSYWHKLIIQAKSHIVYLWLHPTSELSPIINHLEGPLSTFSSPERVSWHWASEAISQLCLPDPPCSSKTVP